YQPSGKRFAKREDKREPIDRSKNGTETKRRRSSRSTGSHRKWLSRFLQCKYLDPASLAECMLTLILGTRPPSWVIVLVDQTTVDGVQAANAPLPGRARAAP